MRKLKFRIWDKEKNTFYTEDEHYRAGEIEEYYTGEVSILFYLFQNIRDSNRYVIQQCTNCVDETGNEIYEGDLVTKYSSDEPVYEVKWMKAYSGYQWCLVDTESKYQDEPDDFYGGLGEYLKIVGNVLDKPPAH